MLSLRANAGTNWPPPPFFLSASPSLYLFLHIYVSPPLLVAAPSLLLFSSTPKSSFLFFSTALQYLTLFFFCPFLFPVPPPPPPPPLPPSPLNASFFFFSSAPPFPSLFFFSPSLFPPLPPPPPFFFVSLSPLFAWCSVGEPRGREIIQSLCILQTLWSVAKPHCTDTLVYLD